jgi:hypothetical protein
VTRARGEKVSNEKAKATGYTRYPVSSLTIYNGSTVLHYVVGGAGIILAYETLLAGVIVGALYMTFAGFQMYVLMPLLVCPNCVYYRLENALCVTGLNLISRRIAKPGDLKDFVKRGQGLLCHNNLYLAALIIPIVAIVPGLIMNFSFLVLGLWLGVVALMLFRFFVVFKKVACIHCRAKNECPNAISMGIGVKKATEAAGQG